MRPRVNLLLLFSLFVLSFPVYSQIRFNGVLQSSLYTFETPENAQHGDFYQGLRLRILSKKNSKIFLNTYLRVAKIGNAAWEERIYNLYVNWQTPRNRFQVRLGRQFLYRGVINGTLDGILLSATPIPRLRLKLFGGLEAPYRRGFEMVGSDSTAWGGYASYRFSSLAKLDLSYFHRRRNDISVWHLLGAGLSGKLNQELYYQFQIDHNLEAETLQGLRARLTYYRNRWSFSGEINSQRPRVFEDSYFRIFELEAYQQLRGGVTYRIHNYQLGVQYIFTGYEEETTNQVILTVGNRWGVIGLVLQDGFGGSNTGLYGDIRYEFLPGLTVKFYSSYYNFQRHAIEISEDATAFSGGLIYRPVRAFSIQAEAQQSINSFYDNDFRGLFRLNYYFTQ